MTDGGADAPPENGGELLLSLLRNPSHRRPRQESPASTILQQPQSPALDPAVVAVGVALPPNLPPPWPSNSRDLPSTTYQLPWPHPLAPPQPLPQDLLGFAPFHLNHFPPDQFHGNQRLFPEGVHKFGLIENANHAIHSLIHHQKQAPPQPEAQVKLQFGSFSGDGAQAQKGLLNGQDSNLSSVRGGERDPGNKKFVHSDSYTSKKFLQHRNFELHEQRGFGNSSGSSNRGKQHHNAYDNRFPKSSAPPGFSNKQRGLDSGSGKSHSSNRMPKGSDLSNRIVSLNDEDERFKRLSIEDGDGFSLGHQLDHPGLPAGSTLPSVKASDIEESMLVMRKEIPDEDRAERVKGNRLSLADSSLLEDDADDKDDKDEKKKRRNPRDREQRIDNRGKWLLNQRLRSLKWKMVCRWDINGLNAPFLALYESLIPAAEEQAKQKQLLALLETLVSKEWPEAKLYLYGSCANSFGFSKSDIDVCLTTQDEDVDKTEMLLKLAQILQSDNLQNVQALTRARVPVVKLMDPATGISCDICINNVLAVVNTKLLRDYARIDERLRQLAFIVKHWAKARGVNETYQGTLSSYAYVLMCIHFLQQRSPPILPCLQEMEPTYSLKVGDIDCSYFDLVEKLRNYGSRNVETIAQLVWGFFNYWAYGHDYANHVISVRTGSIISKRAKDWTRRIGNDRHLICIEDPFETSHDLGRVVDKYSIRVLRGEFERAAEIMQYDENPCTKLFEPYVPNHGS